MSKTKLRVMGRPKRERTVERVNYKLDSGIRNLFKDFILIKRMSEGIAVEKAMLEMIAVDRLVNRDTPLNYQSIEKEIESIWLELNQTGDEENV